MTIAQIKKPTRAEKELLQGALGALEEATGTNAHILEWEKKQGDAMADAFLELVKDHKKTCYIVEIKRTLQPGNLGGVVAQLQRFRKPGMLVTQYVTPQMAERLKNLNVAFADLAGNAYINAPNLFVYVTGKKLPEVDKEAKKIRAFRPTGLQVLFALLCLPDLVKAPYRDIADAAKVALGTVGWVMYDLKRMGYLVERGKHGRKLLNHQKLLDAWVTAYAHELRPKLFLGRYRAPKPEWWQKVDWHKFKVYLGGEPGAAELTQYLKPEKTILYADADINKFLVKNRLAKDAEGDVEIYKTFWKFDYPWNFKKMVPPLLIYADLLATAKDRNIETGKLIYEQYLTRLVGED